MGYLFYCFVENYSKKKKIASIIIGPPSCGKTTFIEHLAEVLNVEIIIEEDPIIVATDGSSEETDPKIISSADDVYKLVLPATYYVEASNGKDTAGAQGTAVGIKPNFFATNCFTQILFFVNSSPFLIFLLAYKLFFCEFIVMYSLG